ncbi:choice-of-anchor D domain-containing protein [candidate division KSB1 bacterium]|nr:choice-of-anchor D domain-containing protein [candidate division KSB1 bacterium]
MKNYFHLLIFIITLSLAGILAAQSADTLYVDDLDPQYSETGAGWQSSSASGYGTSSRAVVGANVSFGQVARWTPEIIDPGYYATYFILPSTVNSRNNALIVVSSFGSVPDSFRVNQNENSGYWRLLGIYYYPAGSESYIETLNDELSTSGYAFRADAVRLVKCPAEPKIAPVRRHSYNFGEVNMGIFEDWTLKIYNVGEADLTINDASTMTGFFTVTEPTFPLVIPGKSFDEITVRFSPNFEKEFTDTLEIACDDPIEPSIRIPLVGEGVAITVYVNNDDGEPHYFEHYGIWNNSTGAFAFPDGTPNPTSRYTYISSGEGRAEFIPQIPTSGLYKIYYGGPYTENAAVAALIEVMPLGSKIDSVYLNQNATSGSQWKLIGTYFLFEGNVNSVHVVNDGTSGGSVVRADVMRFTTVPSVASIELDATSHAFGEVPVNTPAKWHLKISNLGFADLSITDLHTNTEFFQVVSPSEFPLKVKSLDSARVEVSFTPRGVLSYTDTLFIISDDIDDPLLRLRLTGDGIGHQLVVDDSDSSLCTRGPVDTTWHFSSSISGYKGTSIYAFKYQSPGAWVEWALDPPVTMEYDVLVSTIPSGNATLNAPYIVNVPGGLPDTVLVDQTSTTASDIWVHLGRYRFIEGIPTTIKLVNDTTITYADSNAIIRADAVKLTQPVKVKLSAFHVKYEEGDIVLNWETSFELNHRGFNVYRTLTNDRKPASAERLNQEMIYGSNPYRYVDKTAKAEGNYYYWLEDVDLFGYKTLHGPVYASKAFGLPQMYELHQNYPNPFNPETVIKYNLPESGKMDLKIYNVMGQLVRTLADGVHKAGYHSVTWDGRNDNGRMVSSGIYFFKMKTHSAVHTRKMMLLR